MSNYVKGIQKQNAALKKRIPDLLKKIDELKKKFKEAHKNRVPRGRKLKMRWTIEAQDDIKSMHNIDINKELTDILAKEIQQEVDNEIIKDMQAIAKTMQTGNGRSRKRK